MAGPFCLECCVNRHLFVTELMAKLLKKIRKKTGASLPDDQSWHNFVQLVSWEPPLDGFNARWLLGDGELKTKMVNGGSIKNKTHSGSIN